MAILPGIGIIVVFPVPGCVKADRDPEISGPSQEQAKEEREQTGRHDAPCGLVRIKGVPEGEQAGHHECCRPETDSGSKRVLQVSATKEFFNQSGQEECDAPRDERGQNCRPVKSQPGNPEPAQQEHSQQRAADRQKARERPDPEILS